MKWSLQLFLLVSIIILVSCSETHSSIPEDHSLAITVNIKDMTISFVDVDSGEKMEEWQMDKPYKGGLMLPDGDTLLLYGQHIDTVDFFSLKKGQKIDSWITGKGIISGWLLKNEKEIVFADQESNTVRFFTNNGKETGSIAVDNSPFSLIERESKGSLFVISFASETLLEIDLKKKEKIARFPIHASATGVLLKESKGGDEIWIGGHGSGLNIEKDIHVYDADSGELLRKILAPLMPVDLTSKDDSIYALSHGSNTLYKISKEGLVNQSVQVGANPFTIAVFEDLLIVAGYDSNDIHLIDSDSLEIEKTVEVGQGPFQIILRERQ